MTLRWNYHALVGLHGPADPGEWAWRIDSEAAFALVKTAKIEAVKLLASADIGSSVVERLRADGVKWLYARIFNVFNQRMTPETYIGEVEDAIKRLYEAGITHFELCNEPNLGIAYPEGMWKQWQNGREFADWWLIGYAHLKQRYPAMQVGFPGLSPGADEPGLRYDSGRFFPEAMDAVRRADFLNMHTYWDGVSSTLDQSVAAVRQFVELFPDKLVFVSEFSNGNLQTDKAVKGREYVEFYARMKQMPSNLGGAIGYVLSASSGQVEQTWKGSPIPEIVGARPVSVPAPIPTPIPVPVPPIEVKMERAKGLDVSHHQSASFSWARAKAEDGIDFAIPRFSYGLTKDETFDGRLTTALAAGLPCGAYIFPRGDQSIDEQAAFFASLPYHKLDLPMFIDIERDPRQGAIQMDELKTKRLLEEVARITGKLPGVYTGKGAWESLIGKGKTWASRYWLWVANYTSEPYPLMPDSWTNWLIWQHKVAPINSYPSDIDQNVYNGSIDDLRCYWADPYKDWLFQWPTEFDVVTQPFAANPAHYASLLPVAGYGNVGLGHEGLDIRAPNGVTVLAAADGIVRQIITTEAYGINIRIDHQNGLESGYAHLQEALVTVGQRVRSGQRIALADNTGQSTGAHLHFFVKRKNASALGLTSYPSDLIDPTRFMRHPAPAGVKMRMKHTEDINIRAEPKLASLDIGDVAVGEVVAAYPPAIGDYLKIMAHGVLGYSLAKHFEAVVEQPVRLRSIAQPHVNIRSSPLVLSTNDIGDLAFGVEILGYPIPGELFYRVIFNGADAWIMAQYLEVV